MHKGKFVTVIKSRGKILRETGDGIVLLPFDNHYSFLMKNLDNRRAVVSIEIDGKSIGNDLVINGNTEVELERFVDSKHKFRFIKKTEEVIEKQGDHIDDGFIRISVRWETPVPKFESPNPLWLYSSEVKYPLNRTSNQTNNIGSCTRIVYSSASSSTYGSWIGDTEGVTSKGQKSSQTFSSVYIGNLDDDEIVIVFKLRGCTDSELVKHPLYTKTKIKCPECGKKCKSNFEYCSKCGTKLKMNNDPGNWI